MMHRASDVVRTGNTLEHAKQLRLEGLGAERDAVHARGAQGPHELGERGERRRAAAEEDRLELRRKKAPLQVELAQQRVDVRTVLAAPADDSDEVAVAAAVRAERQVHVQVARA